MQPNIIWFPLAESSVSPNATLVNQCNPNGDSIMFNTRDIAFDQVRDQLYIMDYWYGGLTIMNMARDCMELITQSVLRTTDGLVISLPFTIRIDEISDSFYVLDVESDIVVKFRLGSIVGSIVAGTLLNGLLPNKLNFAQRMILDASGQLYIVDSGTQRVVQLLNDKGDLRTIAGRLTFL